MSAPEQDWSRVLERVIEGDRRALIQAARFVNGLLIRWNAYAFRDEWEDVVQEVLSASTLALREGRVRDRQALLAFVMSTARFKFLDRLRIQIGARQSERLPWEAIVARCDASIDAQLGVEAREDVRRALARIPEKKREAVIAVYVEGRTYDEAAAAAGIPLGTFKRYLRDGLAQLRDELAGVLER
jgi:RNA polymerase sigma-70 factor (ECF subfamily)